MIPVTIRPYQDEDFLAVSRLEKSGVHETYRSAVFVRQMAVICQETFLVALLDDDPVGYTVGILVQNDPGEAWILRMGVREDQQRNGIGIILLSELLGIFSRKGVHAVRLTVSPWNVPALGLYLKAGFVHETYAPAYFGGDEDRIIMKKICGQA
jgi:[ribosomal protein S18]-alanine N-acetyltransferase